MSSYSDWEEAITHAIFVQGCSVAHACELLREMWDDARYDPTPMGGQRITRAEADRIAADGP